MREMAQYDLQNALRFYFIREMDVACDIVFDGYEFPEDRPLVTIESMQNNAEVISKQREAVRLIYRFQVGLHAGNAVEKAKLQEEISRVFMFENIPYYNTDLSVDEPVGFFSVDLTSVVPMPTDDISKHSERHRVYFDIEIENNKRSC